MGKILDYMYHKLALMLYGSFEYPTSRIQWITSHKRSVLQVYKCSILPLVYLKIYINVQVVGSQISYTSKPPIYSTIFISDFKIAKVAMKCRNHWISLFILIDFVNSCLNIYHGLEYIMTQGIFDVDCIYLLLTVPDESLY